MCTRYRGKSVSAVIVSLFFIVLSLPVSADLFDKIKETTAKTLGVVKDVKDTVITGKKIGEETRKSRDVLLYNDTTQLSRDQIYQLQLALNNRGYSTGVADGQMGQRTRDAIAAYQRDNGFYADGSLSNQIFASVVSGATPGSQANIQLSRSEWRELQSMLNQLGFNTGTPDGKPGPKTRRAVEAFKRSLNLSAASAERDVFNVATEATGRSPSYSRTNPDVISGQQFTSRQNEFNETAGEVSVKPAVQYTGFGALYRQLMSAWLGSEQSNLPDEVLAAVYVYVFEDHQRQGEYCRSLEGLGNALQASDQLAAMKQRYKQFLQQSALTKSPVQLSYTLTSRNPYKNYDLDQGELVLRGHQWDKRVNLADGRTGLEYTPCSAVLKTPAVAQVQSTVAVPEEFDLDIGDFASSLFAAKARQEGKDTSISSGSFKFMTRVKMDREKAALLLDQDRNSSHLDISVDVTLERAKAAKSRSSTSMPFNAIALKVTAIDESTGIVVHDFNMQSPRSINLPEYLIPTQAAEGSGLPDGLAYYDGAIAIYPEHSGAKLGTTSQTQLALRKLQQKLFLQGAPQLANNVDTALFFADLADQQADQYLNRQPLLSTVKSPNVRWQKVPGFNQDDAMVVVGWQPTQDVFDSERMRRAYASEFGASLIDERIQLPIDFIQLREVGIRTYDVNRKGFPLNMTTKSFGVKLPLMGPNLRALDSYQDIDLTRHVRFLAPFKSIPEIWSVPFEDAEAMQDRLTFTNSVLGRERTDEELAAMLQKNPALSSALGGTRVSKTILATRFRVTGLKYEPPRSGLIGEVRLDTELVSMAIYGDRELSNKIADLQAPPGAIVARSGNDWNANTPKRLEPDTFRLLYLAANHAANKDQRLSDDFWQTAAMDRLELERLVSKNSWSAFKVLKPYWGQFFSQSQLASRQPLTADEIEKYRQWTLNRSEFVGQQFLSGQVSAKKAGETEISTDDLGRQLLDRLISNRSSHGLNHRGDEKLMKASRALAEAEAKSHFSNSSEWLGLFNGDDMHVGIALKANPGWYSQVWTGDVQVTRDSSNPITAVTVDDVHTFTASDGKPGVIVKLDIDSLQYFKDDGSVIRFTPEGTVQSTESADDTGQQNTIAGTSVSQESSIPPLALLDVTLGSEIQVAIDKISGSYNSAVTVEENVSKDPALPTGVRIRLSEKIPDAPVSTVDLFVDREQDKVLAIARTLDYNGLGITPLQIKNSLTDRYGEADAIVEKPPGSKRDTVYLGWGQSAATAAKLGSARFLSDDCILYPVRNYKKREARISTGELKAACGSYLLAYITDRSATFLLIDTNVVMQHREAELENRKLAENEAKKSRADGIKF